MKPQKTLSGTKTEKETMTCAGGFGLIVSVRGSYTVNAPSAAGTGLKKYCVCMCTVC